MAVVEWQGWGVAGVWQGWSVVGVGCGRDVEGLARVGVQDDGSEEF